MVLAGKYAPGGASACLDCLAGQYSTHGAAYCTPCEPGKYCSGKLPGGTARCCPAGATVSDACPDEALVYPSGAIAIGTYSGTQGICTREMPGGECDSGVQAHTCNGFGTGTCSAQSICQRVSSLLCIPGMWSSVEQTSCENCAPGRYSFFNNASCMDCTPGSFCAGGPVAEVAPQVNDAQFDDASLQLNIHHAMPHMAPADDLTSRQSCPNGTWSNDQRLVEAGGDASVLAWCANCSVGMFSLMGSTACTNCTAGRYSHAGWPVCQNCTRSTCKYYKNSLLKTAFHHILSLRLPGISLTDHMDCSWFQTAPVAHIRSSALRVSSLKRAPPSAQARFEMRFYTCLY